MNKRRLLKDVQVDGMALTGAPANGQPFLLYKSAQADQWPKGKPNMDDNESIVSAPSAEMHEAIRKTALAKGVDADDALRLESVGHLLQSASGVTADDLLAIAKAAGIDVQLAKAKDEEEDEEEEDEDYEDDEDEDEDEDGEDSAALKKVPPALREKAREKMAKGGPGSGRYPAGSTGNSSKDSERAEKTSKMANKDGGSKDDHQNAAQAHKIAAASNRADGNKSEAKHHDEMAAAHNKAAEHIGGGGAQKNFSISREGAKDASKEANAASKTAKESGSSADHHAAADAHDKAAELWHDAKNNARAGKHEQLAENHREEGGARPSDRDSGGRAGGQRAADNVAAGRPKNYSEAREDAKGSASAAKQASKYANDKGGMKNHNVAAQLHESAAKSWHEAGNNARAGYHEQQAQNHRAAAKGDRSATFKSLNSEEGGPMPANSERVDLAKAHRELLAKHDEMVERLEKAEEELQDQRDAALLKSIQEEVAREYSHLNVDKDQLAGIIKTAREQKSQRHHDEMITMFKALNAQAKMASQGGDIFKSRSVTPAFSMSTGGGSDSASFNARLEERIAKSTDPKKTRHDHFLEEAATPEGRAAWAASLEGSN